MKTYASTLYLQAIYGTGLSPGNGILYVNATDARANGIIDWFPYP